MMMQLKTDSSAYVRVLRKTGEELNALVARWENEKAGRNKVGDLRVQLDELVDSF